MVGILDFIWSWLERGYNLATDNTRSIWNEAKVIFKMAVDTFTSICKNFQAYIAYCREKSWKKEDGSVVEVC